MGKVMAACISSKRGIEKHRVEEIILKEDWGIVGDAHAGDWHRQVSLLSFEKINDFNEKGANVKDGAFGENLIIEGYDLKKIPIGTVLVCNEVRLQVTQIGKECHSHCTIYQKMGDCIMPREGVFAKVVKGGTIRAGDEIMIESSPEAAMTAIVITMSDKGSAKERVDESGPMVCAMLQNAGYVVKDYLLLPDEKEQLKQELIRFCDEEPVDLIVTNGGTGFSRRDITPEATAAVAERMVPGIAEAMRMNSMQITKRAVLSRGISVIRKQTLILNLPGSPKAVKENLSFVLPELEHGIAILKGEAMDCARK